MWSLVLCLLSAIVVGCATTPTASYDQVAVEFYERRSAGITRCDSSMNQTKMERGHKAPCATARPWWHPVSGAISGAAMAVRRPDP